MLAPRHVHTHDRDIDLLANRLSDSHRVTCIRDNDLVGETGRTHLCRLTLSRHQRHDARRTGLTRRRERERARLAATAEHQHGPTRVPPHHTVRQRRCTTHVENGQRQFVGHVGRQHGRDRPPEQHRGPPARHLLVLAAPVLQPVVDLQGRQREADQRRDPVARLQPERRRRPDLQDRAEQHAARAGDRVLHLAALGDDVQHSLPDRVTIAVLLPELPERRRVQVEPLDRDDHLVGRGDRVRVEPPRLLGQHTSRLEDAVQSVRAHLKILRSTTLSRQYLHVRRQDTASITRQSGGTSGSRRVRDRPWLRSSRASPSRPSAGPRARRRPGRAR